MLACQVSELTGKTIYFKVLEHYWGEHIHMGGGLCFVPHNSSMINSNRNASAIYYL